MRSHISPTWDLGQTHATARVNNWHEFVAILETNFLDWTEYIFRGQRDTNWTLRSKFDREYRSAIQLLEETDPLQKLDKRDRGLIEQANPNLSLDSRNNLLERHLARFKKFCTGRRGISPKSLTDNEWWALGQHFGLSTPFLDWTKSPYVAAYFALREKTSSKSDTRAIWAYTQFGLEDIFLNMKDKLAAILILKKN